MEGRSGSPVERTRTRGSLVPHANNTALRETPVFTQGEGEAFYAFRIPSLVVAQSGTVLAFCEARDLRTNRGDHCRNDIVLKRSADMGRTWTPLQVVVSDGDNSLNNPTAVVLRETGRIILMYQRYPFGFHSVPHPEHGIGGVEPGNEGDRICRTFVTASDDDGKTWSAPREITRSVKRPTETTASLCGPGVGIQLRRGPHKGRLLFPFYQYPRPNQTYAVYSDDFGETWHYGELAPIDCEGTGNENQLVELADGSVMVNSRLAGQGARCRKVGTSRDGGQTWSGLVDEPALIGPGCQGSIFRYSDPLDGRRSRILFCNPASETGRENGTVRLSYDEGRTWPFSKPIKDAGMFAYCCLCVLSDMTIGCLYESTSSPDEHMTIMFAGFTLDWLTDGSDTMTCRPFNSSNPVFHENGNSLCPGR